MFTSLNKLIRTSIQSPSTAESRIPVSKLDHGESQIYAGKVLLPDGLLTSYAAAERFRTLRAKIERHNLKDNNDRLLAVTSAIPGEGKSIVAANLARALSLDPTGKTILVDADLRRPNVHRLFNVPEKPGLSDVLRERIALQSVTFHISDKLDVISAGSTVEDPTQMIEHPDLSRLFAFLKEQYRYVIIDCPPVMLCPDPIALVQVVDSMLLVVRAWKTKRRLVKEAIAALGAPNILGVIFNDSENITDEYRRYGSYYGSYYNAWRTENASKNKSEDSQVK